MFDGTAAAAAGTVNSAATATVPCEDVLSDCDGRQFVVIVEALFISWMRRSNDENPSF